MLDLARWKSLHARYKDDRPHRLLALDGGGIRGLITLGILERLEALLKERTGQSLPQYFDYIAGTSTGAIIAAGLARGLTVAQLVEFYTSCGEQMFESSKLWERGEVLLQRSDAVLVDLRGFTRQNAGVIFELNALVEAVPLDRVVMATDDTTDAVFLDDWSRTTDGLAPARAAVRRVRAHLRAGRLDRQGGSFPF